MERLGKKCVRSSMVRAGLGTNSRFTATVAGHFMEKKMSSTIQKREVALNARIQAGDVLGALKEFYAENVEMREGSAPKATVGKQENLNRLEQFLGSLKQFNGATLHNYAVGDDVSMSEWTFDMVGGDGSPIIWNEVIRRRWSNGAVIDERYYNTTP